MNMGFVLTCDGQEEVEATIAELAEQHAGEIESVTSEVASVVMIQIVPPLAYDYEDHDGTASRVSIGTEQAAQFRLNPVCSVPIDVNGDIRGQVAAGLREFSSNLLTAAGKLDGQDAATEHENLSLATLFRKALKAGWHSTTGAIMSDAWSVACSHADDAECVRRALGQIVTLREILPAVSGGESEPRAEQSARNAFVGGLMDFIEIGLRSNPALIEEARASFSNLESFAGDETIEMWVSLVKSKRIDD